GNIFRLGTKYSEPMGATVLMEDGTRQAVSMGCYGIGISRLMGTIAEIYGEVSEKTARINWPEAVAPVRIHLLDLTEDRRGEMIYEALKAAGEEVLYDDRDRRPGEKFADADLIGAPWRIVVSPRSLEAGGVEMRHAAGEAEIVSLERIQEVLNPAA